MSKFNRYIMCSIGVAALAAGVFAADEKKPAAKKGSGAGILQPQMTVENGSYAAPMGKLGTPASEPWSATTVGAAVDGKPNPGAKEATVVGEIVDFSCYLQIGKHGEKHRACAQKCFTSGQPVGLLTSDGSLYMLMEEEHDPRRDGQTSDFRKAAVDHAGHIMEVTGTQWSLGGYKALYVRGFVKK
jgi:hypothetical protein